MSKEAALAIMTGAPAPAPVAEVTTQSPGLAEAPPVETPKPQELDSTRFKHLAAKEAEIVKMREEAKRERELIAQERAKLEPAKKEWETFMELKEKDKIAAIKSMGFTDTDILNAFAAVEDTMTPEQKAAKAAQDEIQKFRDEQAAAQAKAQQETNERVLQKFKEDVDAFVTTNKDKYEYINFNGQIGQELVKDTIAAILEESKELISIEEASDLVEAYYEDLDKKMATLKKRNPTPVEAAPVEPVKEEPLRAEVNPRPAPPKTLSNKVNATVAATVTRKETPNEKRQRLIRQLGELKI
jgi:hypothetical protein